MERGGKYTFAVFAVALVSALPAAAIALDPVGTVTGTVNDTTSTVTETVNDTVGVNVGTNVGPSTSTTVNTPVGSANVSTGTNTSGSNPGSSTTPNATGSTTVKAPAAVSGPNRPQVSVGTSTNSPRALAKTPSVPNLLAGAGSLAEAVPSVEILPQPAGVGQNGFLYFTSSADATQKDISSSGFLALPDENASVVLGEVQAPADQSTLAANVGQTAPDAKRPSPGILPFTGMALLFLILLGTIMAAGGVSIRSLPKLFRTPHSFDPWQSVGRKKMQAI